MLHPSTSHFHCSFQNLYGFHSQLSTMFALPLVASGLSKRCSVFHLFKFYLLKVCKLFFDVHHPSSILLKYYHMHASYSSTFIYQRILYVKLCIYWMHFIYTECMNGWLWLWMSDLCFKILIDNDMEKRKKNSKSIHWLLTSGCAQKRI